MNKITMKSNPDQILKMFRECKDTESINLETKKGYIYEVGGILCKLEDNNHFIANKNKWVLISHSKN